MVTLLAGFAPILAAEAAAAGGRSIPDWAKGNTIFETFFKGGPMMYPIVAVLVVAVAVILERVVWWTIQTTRRDADKLDKVYAALEQGNIAGAVNLAHGSKDPLVRTVWHGLNHVTLLSKGLCRLLPGRDSASRPVYVSDGYDDHSGSAPRVARDRHWYHGLV